MGQGSLSRGQGRTTPARMDSGVPLGSPGKGTLGSRNTEDKALEVATGQRWSQHDPGQVERGTNGVTEAGGTGGQGPCRP